MNDTNMLTGAGARARLQPTETGARSPRTPWRTLALGLAAGVGASLCCLPILFILAGIGGAWMGALTAMEPYRPYFLGLTIVFLGFAFRGLYLAPRACVGEEACGTPRTLRRQRAVLWAVTLVVGLLIGIPWYAPYLIG